mmetsp:Transcript_4366/g.11318  ORF Transcript_4366/g.11318 Transcript_4366/m.11318 type:complete len:305 (+) Transcript_4366:52-966(+)
MVTSSDFICPGHSRPVVGLQYSAETEDGTFLLSACHDKTAMLRDGESGDWIGTFEGHNGAVWWAALNPTATLVATASGDFSAKVWNAITGDEQYTFKHKHIVRTVDWTPDSRRVATAGKEQIVRIFDIGKPDAEPDVLSGHEKLIKVLLCTNEPSGVQLLTGGDDKTLRTWDLRTLKQSQQLDLDGAITSVAMSQDGKMLTVAAGDDVLFLDRATLSIIRKHSIPTINGVNSAALHPNGRSFVAGGGNFWVYLYDYETCEELQCSKGHHGPVYCVRFGPSGQYYTSGGDDGTIRTWRVQNSDYL